MGGGEESVQQEFMALLVVVTAVSWTWCLPRAELFWPGVLLLCVSVEVAGLMEMGGTMGGERAILGQK